MVVFLCACKLKINSIRGANKLFKKGEVGENCLLSKTHVLNWDENLSLLYLFLFNIILILTRLENNENKPVTNSRDTQVHP